MSLKKEITVAVLGLIGIGMLWVGWNAYESLTGNSTGLGPVACTREAKICPDGSAVGRAGPQCEFAPCPSGNPLDDSAVALMLRIGEAGNAPGLGVSITPEEVLEDSRCPVDVVCIQAGTVRVRVQLSIGVSVSEHTFEVGTTIATDAKKVTLAHVSPQPRAGEKISPDSYQFLFEIEQQSTNEQVSE